MKNRITDRFDTLRQEGRKAFIAYLTAGDPDLRTTEELVLRLEKAGVDIMEIGVPFSDPTADGPAIQAAAQRALKKGATLEGILATVKEIRKRSQLPIVLFGYFNPILSYGPERFAKDAAAAGVDGLLVVDLPPEESAELRRYTDPAGLAFITLVAPTTDAGRCAGILRGATGFVYYISITGVTGTAVPNPESVRRDVARIRKLTRLPIAVGFGISTPAQATAIAPWADGVVIGSALVRLIAEGGGRKRLIGQAAAFAAAIRRAIDAAGIGGPVKKGLTGTGAIVRRGKEKHGDAGRSG